MIIYIIDFHRDGGAFSVGLAWPLGSGWLIDSNHNPAIKVLARMMADVNLARNLKVAKRCIDKNEILCYYNTQLHVIQ